GALLVLIVLTSLAVASVSAWLVLPYLALMALLVFAPSGQRERGKVDESTTELETATRVEEEVVDPAPADLPVADGTTSATEVPSSSPEPRAVKTKRGKGRMRKAKVVAESPGATATWIQTGPGKFVRVESPCPAVAASSSPSGDENKTETEDARQ